MNRSHRYRLFLLVLSAAGSGALLFNGSALKTSDTGDASAAESGPAPENPVGQFRLAGLTELSEVVNRPLFFEGRQFVAIKESPSEVDQENAEPVVFPEIKITGIVGDRGNFMAVLKDTATKQEHTIFPGANLPGRYSDWRVESAFGDKIIIEKHSESFHDNDVAQKSIQKEIAISEEGRFYSITK